MSGDLSQSIGPAGNGPLDSSDRLRVGLWYSQQVDWLRVFTFGILRDGELVAEVLQTAFCKAIERGASVEPHAVRAWLTRVAYNEAMLLKRRQAVVSRALRKIGAGISECDSTLPPINGLMQRETAAKVREAVNRLPAEQRFVVNRRIDGDQTFAEIAAELNVPLGTVLTRMRLALGKLRTVLAEEQSE